MISLDGNYGEGGGVLIRTALALSTLTGKSFEVTNIRAGRPESGLKAQHLSAITALKQLCDARTNEVSIGSEHLTFVPGKIKKGNYRIDIGTAGSISLLLQALILPCLFAPGKITLNIKGGTCGKWQASAHYLQNVLLPQLKRFAENIELKIIRHGYYPKGSGEVQLIIAPKKNFQELTTPKIILTQQGSLEQVRGIINLSAELQEKEVAPRIKMSAESPLKKYRVPINSRIEYTTAPSIGGEIVLWALFSANKILDPDNPVILGSDALIEKGKRSEEIGREAAERLMQEISSGAAVDHYLADQLIPFMGLLPGSEILCSKISEHTRTNIYVVEKFLKVKFLITGNKIKVEQA